MACANKHEELASVLVFKGANVNAVDVTGASPLHYAVSTGLSATVELLLEHGADVGVCDRYRRTPLLAAIEMHHGKESKAVTIVQSLARKGAVLNPRPPTVSPLMHAVLHSKDGALVRALCELGSDPSAADVVGVTPVYNAVAMGCHRALETLLQCGASLLLKDGSGAGLGLTMVHLVALQVRRGAWGDAIDLAGRRGLG